MRSFRTAPLALLFVTTHAAAELSIEGDATPWEGVERRLDAESQGRRGWYVEGGVAVGGCTGELCADVLSTGVGPGLRLGIGYQFAPLFSLGATLDLQSISATGEGLGCNTESCRLEDVAASWRTLSVAGRFHLVRSGALDPFVGFLAGAAQASAEAELHGETEEGARVNTSVAGSLSGATLGAEAGVAWLPTPRFAVTLSIRFWMVAWSDACFENGQRSTCGGADQVHAATDRDVVTARDLPSLWSIAVGVRGMP